MSNGGGSRFGVHLLCALQVPFMHEYWLTKALWYVDNQKTNVKVRPYPNDEGYYYIVWTQGMT